MPDPTATDDARHRDGVPRLVRRVLWTAGLVIGLAVARDLAIRRNDRPTQQADRHPTHHQR